PAELEPAPGEAASEVDLLARGGRSEDAAGARPAERAALGVTRELGRAAVERVTERSSRGSGSGLRTVGTPRRRSRRGRVGPERDTQVGPLAIGDALERHLAGGEGRRKVLERDRLRLIDRLRGAAGGEEGDQGGAREERPAAEGIDHEDVIGAGGALA